MNFVLRQRLSILVDAAVMTRHLTRGASGALITNFANQNPVRRTGRDFMNLHYISLLSRNPKNTGKRGFSLTPIGWLLYFTTHF